MARRRAPRTTDPSADLYPVSRNPRYQLDERIPQLSDERLVTTYNNFYEFGSHKQISKAAQALEIRPWTVTLDGMVEQERTLDIDDLLRQMPLEERVYRHRCVEAWSMAVPWSGFPLKALVDLARPLGGATYLRMETFLDPDTRIGPEAVLVSVALRRRADHRRGDARARVHRDRPLRQADPEAERRAAAPGSTLEIRLQVDQVDRPLHLHRRAPAQFLAGDPGQRVRLLGERQSRGPAPALEPGRGDPARQPDEGADRAVQRLWRVRGRSVQGPGERAAVHVRDAQLRAEPGTGG